MLSRPATGRLRTRLAVVAALIAGGVGAGAPAGDAEANVLLVSRHRTETGPLGPITVIGDSVLVGSVYQPWGPTLDDHLIARGWGPVRVRAGVGQSTGRFTSGPTTVPYWIQQWRSQGWNPVDVMVNIGANDSATCEGDVECAFGAISHVVDAIGPGHRIWWPKITHHPVVEHRQFAWNEALDRMAAQNPDFYTWDWPSMMFGERLHTSDFIHLTVDGYRRRSDVMATEITADLARAERTGTDAPLPAPAGATSELVPIGPTRVLDTRDDPPGRVTGGTAIEVDVSGHAPPGATAAAVYVTATQTGADGYLTAFDCTIERPKASAANYRAGQTRGAVTITPLSPTGTFCLYSRADAHLVVDLQGAFVAAGDDGGQRFTPLAEPTRLADTRESGRRRIVEVDVPAGADAAAVSITAVDGATRGYLVAYPCTDEVPLIATVNHGAAEVVAGTAFVPVSPDGTICVFAKADVDVVVDLTGVFADDGDLVFVPVPSTRTIDTRIGVGGWAPMQGQLQTIDARVAPPEAEAVSGTLTLVRPLRRGHLRAWGCGDLPETANVTAGAGGVLANSLTTGVSDDGRLCVYARSTTTTVFDTTGWWIPAT